MLELFGINKISSSQPLASVIKTSESRHDSYDWSLRAFAVGYNSGFSLFRVEIWVAFGADQGRGKSSSSWVTVHTFAAAMVCSSPQLGHFTMLFAIGFSRLVSPMTFTRTPHLQRQLNTALIMRAGH